MISGTIGILLVVVFLLPLLGCFLLRKKNKKMEQECYNANIEKIRAIKEMSIAQNEKGTIRKKAVIMFFFLLRRGEITPESEDAKLKEVVNSLQSRQEGRKAAKGILGLSELTASLFSEFNKILVELRLNQDNDPNAVGSWLTGIGGDPLKNLALMGLQDLEDVEKLYSWAEEKYFLTIVGEEVQS